MHADRRDVVTVSAAGRPDADWRATDVRMRRDGTRFTAVGPGGLTVPVQLELPGRFNVDNGLAALAALAQLGVDPVAAARGLASLDFVPGRMQWVVPSGIRVNRRDAVLGLIDYAHTPEALRALLGAVRQVASAEPSDPDRAPRILLVFGTGGGRDSSKREGMGQAAAIGADVVVLTDDNPRYEDPDAIVAALRSGIDTAPGQRPETHVERHRGRAIALGVRLARPGDLVVVAGKGPDRVQLVRGHVLPVDDEGALRAALSAHHECQDTNPR